MKRYQSNSEIDSHINTRMLSQQKQVKHTLVVNQTVDNIDHLHLNTLLDMKNNVTGTTFQRTSESFTQAATTAKRQSRVREAKKQQLSSLRPITAQPFIKSRAYIVKDLPS